MSVHDDVFFQVPQTVVSTSEGAVALPIMYYEASALYAFFLVDTERVAEVTSNPRLTPALTVGGRSLVSIACYEYRDTSVGVYNEVGLAVSATADGAAPALGGWPDLLGSFSSPEQRQVGMHVLDLPVTTAAANAAGREIWGLPKFVTDISYEKHGQQFSCQVADPDGAEPLMTLAGKIGPSIPGRPMSVTLYSELDGHLHRCTVNARGRTHTAPVPRLKLTTSGSTHPMAGRLRALGLDGAAPIGVMWSDAFQSRLNAGVDVPSGHRTVPGSTEPAATKTAS